MSPASPAWTGEVHAAAQGIRRRVLEHTLKMGGGYLSLLVHPSFQGSFVTGRDSGISHYALFGQLPRLAGADGSIFPNYGGRFAFTRDDCRAIAAGTAVEMGNPADLPGARGAA